MNQPASVKTGEEKEMGKVTDFAAAAVEKSVEKKKQKRKKKIRKRIRRLIRGILRTALVLGFGIFIGVHRKAIKAWLKGEPLPELPAGHPQWCHKA